MASGFEVKVRVGAEVITELADSYVNYMELPENYDTEQLVERLGADPEFRKVVMAEFTRIFQDIAADHWSHDIADSIWEADMSSVGWLAEIEQDIREEDELAEFEESLINESRWVLEAESARQMLTRLGWTVERPVPVRRKKKNG